MISFGVNHLKLECESDAISALAKQWGIASPVFELVLPQQQAAQENEEDTPPEQRSASCEY